jgi:hypothetical protein
VAAEDRILKILLQIKGDIADVPKVTGALKEVEAQAIATAKATGAAVDIGALSAQGRLDLAQTLETSKGVGVFAAAANVEAAGMATNFGIAGMNLSKARQEAIVLAREIATGNVRASTLGSLLGSAGTAITISALAAYELYHLLSSAADESLRLTQETRKQSDELVKQLDKWNEMAAAAGDFGDVVKFGEHLQTALDAASAKLEAFRNKEVGLFQWAWDEIWAQGWGGIPGSPSKLDKQTADQKSELQSLLRDVVALRETAKAANDTWESLQLGPVNVALAKTTDLLDQAKAKYLALASAAHMLAVGILDDAKTAQLQRDLKDLDAEGEKVKLLTKRVDDLTTARDKEEKAGNAAARKAQQDAVNASLRESSLLLSDIRQKQQLISQDPFLSTEQKQIQLANSYRREQELILLEILKIKLMIAQSEAVGGPKEQAEVDRLTAKLHGLGFEYQALANKVKSLSVGGELRADLTAWANSFGSTMHQVAGIITGTLNVAIAQTAQLLTDAIFRTADWKAAVLAVGEAGVKMIIQMLLQWIISRTLMSVLNAVFGKADASAANQLAVSSAAAWSAAAVSASIATEGVAAGLGTTAYIAALAAGLAASTGVAAGSAATGFARGGYTGSGGAGEYAGPAHKGEFLFSKSQTENIGLGNLYALAAAAPHFGTGGRLDSPDLPPLGDSGAPNRGGPGSSWWDAHGSRFQPDNYYQSPDWTGGGPPSIEVGGGPDWYGNSGLVTFTPSGAVKGGTPGPQGSIYGRDPNTGELILNADAYSPDEGGGWPLGMDIAKWVFAEGGRVPGPASKSDTVLAWLSTGERVIPADQNILLEKSLGANWPSHFDNMSFPVQRHFAGGGRVGASSSAGAGGGSIQVPIKIINVTDWKTALAEAQKDDSHRTFIVDTVRGAAHEIGIGAVN